MSDDKSDAEYERRYPQKQSGIPVWAVLLLVLGAVGFFGVFGLVALGMMFGAVAATPVPPPVVMATAEPPRQPEYLTRATFELAVTGKTVDEVKAMLGEPPMSGGTDGEETWMYRKRTTNPATGQPDDRTDVVFRGGKAVRVDYRTDAPPGGPGPPPGK